MTTLLSQSTASPSTSPQLAHPPSPNPNLSSLSQINTNQSSLRNARAPASSYARNRMSTLSTASSVSQRPSRPPSHIYTVYHSSLAYTQVRDFAYPHSHLLHYGAPAESSAAPSGQSTPSVEFYRPLSAAPETPWDGPPARWPPTSWDEENVEAEQLPQMAYGEERDHGPPYSEDEDLHSPVVVSYRQKKKGQPTLGRNPSKGGSRPTRKRSSGPRSHPSGRNSDGSERTRLSDIASESTLYPTTYHGTSGSGTPSKRSSLQPGSFTADENRYSRDYQFSIASPDEEMHGKAVALFDFARENENELPLVEGQVIWVSYRHGQGWLVAEDPRSRESGLVPEEYVRLLRDIEGGWVSPEARTGSAAASPSPSPIESANGNGDADAADDRTLTPNSPQQQPSSQPPPPTFEVTSNGDRRARSVVSIFSTSSRDLQPYPHRIPGALSGAPPPQVVHYGSASGPEGKADERRHEDANGEMELDSTHDEMELDAQSELKAEGGKSNETVDQMSLDEDDDEDEEAEEQGSRAKNQEKATTR